MHYRARHSRSVDNARPCEIPRTPPPADHTGIRCRGTPPDTAGRGRCDRSWREQRPGDSSAEFCLMFDPMPGIVRRRLNAFPCSFPGLVGGGPLFAGDHFVLDPVVAPCGGRAFVLPSDQSWPTAALHQISVERGEWSSPLRPAHPGDYCGVVASAVTWNKTGLAGVSLGGLEQAELAGAGDRGGAALNAQFAVQGALVGLHGVH